MGSTNKTPQNQQGLSKGTSSTKSNRYPPNKNTQDLQIRILFELELVPPSLENSPH